MRNASSLRSFWFVVILAGCGGSNFDVASGSDDAGDAEFDGTTTDGSTDVAVDATTETGPIDGTPAEVLVDADPEATVDASCAPGTTQSCYGGAASELTAPSTACRAGVQHCIGGAWGPCIGEVRPTPESCNGVDDDCNGSIDDGIAPVSCGIGACASTAPACSGGKPSTCVSKSPIGEICGNGIDDDCDGVVDDGCGCVHVAPSGSDGSLCGTSALPCRTIQFAINKAGTPSTTGTWPKQVCVASQSGCGSGSTLAIYDESIKMKNGVSVLGSYNPGTWNRNGGCRTQIRAQDHNGVTFDVSITAPTTLDGFEVQAKSEPTNAAISIFGSTGAIVDNCTVDGGGGTNSVGILVTDAAATKATPILHENAITGGSGSASAIGVRVVKSAPRIVDSCSDYDGSTGRCRSSGCFGASRFVRGRASGSSGAAGSSTFAIRLEDAAGTVIDGSAVCSGAGQGDVAAVRISGDGSGVVIRKNSISAPAGGFGNANSVGVWATACGGASPWIVDNWVIAGQSRTTGGRADGVRAVGDCHPRIESNREIIGGDESSSNDANGVHCAKDVATGVSSRCTVLGNASILGSAVGFPPSATGVRCDPGACARIERNAIISGSRGTKTFGVVLDRTSTFLDGNVILAGCAQEEGIGLLAIDAPARVQNTYVFGASTCSLFGGSVFPKSSTAAKVLIGSGAAEIDLHSSTLHAFAYKGSCTSRALALDVAPGAAPLGPRGLFRNLILHAGSCSQAFGLDEMNAAADPRVFQGIDIWASTTPAGLYRDEGSTTYTTPTAILALTDMSVSNVISADPRFVSGTDYHLQSSSPCRNAGVATGAPARDWDGDSRPQESAHDIGADEYKP